MYPPSGVNVADSCAGHLCSVVLCLLYIYILYLRAGRLRRLNHWFFGFYFLYQTRRRRSWCGLEHLYYNFLILTTPNLSLSGVKRKKASEKCLENYRKSVNRLHTGPGFPHHLLSRSCIFITRHRYYSCDDFSYTICLPMAVIVCCACMIFRPPTTNGTSSPLSLRVFFFL